MHVPVTASRSAEPLCARSVPLPRQPAGGFTLVELVMVIALAGIVATMVATVMSRPLQSFFDQSRRTELTELAAGALNRMARDIRLAVPNSLRAPDERTLELLAIHEAGRYRANRLSVEGARQDPPRCSAAGVCSIPVLSPGMSGERVAEARWMVVYSLGAESGGAPLAGSNVWAHADPGVITPTGTRFALSTDGTTGEAQLSLSGLPGDGFRFAYASPQHRFYLAREVVRYRCENVGGTRDGEGEVWREVSDSLDFQSPRRALLVDHVAACSFGYAGATHARNALATLRLVLLRDGERISLVQQVHVDNAP